MPHPQLQHCFILFAEVQLFHYFVCASANLAKHCIRCRFVTVLLTQEPVPGLLLSTSLAWAPASAAAPTRRKSRTPPPTGASAVTDVTEHRAPKRSPQRSDVVWFGVLRAAHVAGSYPQLGAKGEGMEAL